MTEMFFIHSILSLTKTKLLHNAESKVLQYFCNMKHNSAASDAFLEFVNVMKMSTSPDTLWLLLASFVSMVWSIALEYTLLVFPDRAWLWCF